MGTEPSWQLWGALCGGQRHFQQATVETRCKDSFTYKVLRGTHLSLATQEQEAAQ